jgi:hypothetical protein
MRTTFAAATLSLFVPACGGPYTVYEPPPRWSSVQSTLPGVVVIEEVPDNPVCTGTVIQSEPGRSLALTVQSCLGDSAHPSDVAVPDATSGGWTRYPITRTYEHGSAQRRIIFHGPAAEWQSNWAIVEIATPGALAVLPLESERATLRHGDEVSLETYFGSDPLAPHMRTFRWGDDVAPQLLHRGIFGAPLVRRGRVVGIFSGATGTKRLFSAPTVDKPIFTNAQTIREEALDRGLVLATAQ